MFEGLLQLPCACSIVMGAKCTCFEGSTDRKQELEKALSRNITPASTPMEPLDYPEEPVALSQLHPRVRDLFELIKTKPQISDISLAGKELGNQGALHLGIIIEHTPELRSLDVSCCSIQWEGMANIGLSLRRLRQLQVLRLSGNDLGLKGAQYLASALTFLHEIKTLALNETNLGPKGMRLVAHRLKDTPVLEELLLCRNALGDEGGEELAQFLGRCPALQLLDLSYNGLKDCFPSLQRAWRKLSSLQVLKLDGNLLGDEGARSISEALGKLSTLCHLDLSYNELTYEGIESLQTALAGLVALRELFLEGNYVGRQGAHSLATAVCGLPALRVIGLANCGVNEARTEIRLAAPKVDILLYPLLPTPRLAIPPNLLHQHRNSGVNHAQFHLQSVLPAPLLHTFRLFQPLESLLQTVPVTLQLRELLFQGRESLKGGNTEGGAGLGKEWDDFGVGRSGNGLRFSCYLACNRQKTARIVVLKTFFLVNRQFGHYFWFPLHRKCPFFVFFPCFQQSGVLFLQGFVGDCLFLPAFHLVFALKAAHQLLQSSQFSQIQLQLRVVPCFFGFSAPIEDLFFERFALFGLCPGY